MAGVLAKYVDAFVDGVAADLGELSGRDHRKDAVIEASGRPTRIPREMHERMITWLAPSDGS